MLLIYREYGTDDTSLEANSQDENLNEVSTVGLNTDIGEEESDEDKEGEDQEEEDDREFPGSRSVIKLESIKTSNIQGDMFVDSSEYFLGSAHKIQRWFGVRRFAVLIPSSATCRILDPQVISFFTLSRKRHSCSFLVVLCCCLHYNQLVADVMEWKGIYSAGKPNH